MNIYAGLIQATRSGGNTAASVVIFSETEVDALHQTTLVGQYYYPAADGWFIRPSVSLAGELWGMVVAGGRTYKSTSQAEAERLTRNLIADVTKLEAANEKLRELLNLALHDLSCSVSGEETVAEIYAALEELDGTGDTE